MTKKSVCNISPNNIDDNTNHNRHNNNNSSSISVAFLVVHTYHFSVSIWIPFNVCVLCVCVCICARVRMIYFPYSLLLVHVSGWLSLFQCVCVCVCYFFGSMKRLFHWMRNEKIGLAAVADTATASVVVFVAANDHGRARTSLYRWAIGGQLLNVYCNVTTSWYIVVNTLQWYYNWWVDLDEMHKWSQRMPSTLFAEVWRSGMGTVYAYVRSNARYDPFHACSSYCWQCCR